MCGPVYGTPQEPLFNATDVAKWINHSDVSKMIQKVDDDEKLLRTLFGAGQNREVWFLTENGLYEVLMQSRKPIAKQFKKGVKTILKEVRVRWLHRHAAKRNPRTDNGKGTEDCR